jgi:hypothetical protein
MAKAVIEKTIYRSGSERDYHCIRTEPASVDDYAKLLPQMLGRMFEEFPESRQRAEAIRSAGNEPRVKQLDAVSWIDPIAEDDLLAICVLAVEDNKVVAYLLPVSSFIGLD